MSINTMLLRFKNWLLSFFEEKTFEDGYEWAIVEHFDHRVPLDQIEGVTTHARGQWAMGVKRAVDNIREGKLSEYQMRDSS